MIKSESIRVSGYEIERASGKLKCFQNALKATLDIYKKSKEEVLPRIWRVVIPEMNDSHAYLQIGEEVYNAGITWTNEKYPEFNIEELKKKGMDVTTSVLVQGVLELKKNYQGERMGFGEVIKGMRYGGDNEMKIFMEKMIGKSVTEEGK